MSYAALARDLRAGDILVVDDGRIKLRALSTDGCEVRCQVVDDGPLSAHKGVNLLGTTFAAPALSEKDHDDLASPAQAIAAAATVLASTVDAKAMVVFTQTGRTARWLASQRSPVPVLAFTSVPEVRSPLAVTWGVETFVAPLFDASEAVAIVDHPLVHLGRGRPGERLVIIADDPGQSGTTNTLPIHELASVYASSA